MNMWYTSTLYWQFSEIYLSFVWIKSIYGVHTQDSTNHAVAVVTWIKYFTLFMGTITLSWLSRCCLVVFVHTSILKLYAIHVCVQCTFCRPNFSLFASLAFFLSVSLTLSIYRCVSLHSIYDFYMKFTPSPTLQHKHTRSHSLFHSFIYNDNAKFTWKNE